MHSQKPDERQILASNMCGDFDDIIGRAGFGVACIVLFDEQQIKLNESSLILSFGKNMDPMAAFALMKIIGEKAKTIIGSAIKVTEENK